jgi:hypothetical protein
MAAPGFYLDAAFPFHAWRTGHAGGEEPLRAVISSPIYSIWSVRQRKVPENREKTNA